MNAGLLAVASLAGISAMGLRGPRALRATSAATFFFDQRGRVLLLRRSPTDPWRPGWWNLPGGGLEPGESVLEGARREAREEAGLRLLDAVEVHQIQGGRVRLLLALAWSGRVRLDYEHDDYAWVDPERVVEYQLLPGILDGLKEIE
jgi:8-oxo-dGTP pyrophosphatase MutT (NUDIX family)